VVRHPVGVSGGAEVLVALVMLVGLVGAVVPVLPGLPVIWLAGLVWVLADGGGGLRWGTLAVMTLLMGVGLLAGYLLPGRAAASQGSPPWVLLVAVVSAIVGFFLVPLVGFLLGFVAGLMAAELARVRDAGRAWRATLAAVKGYGIGVAVSVVAGTAMIAVWAAGVVAT
jgi:hypothetical protein